MAPRKGNASVQKRSRRKRQTKSQRRRRRRLVKKVKSRRPLLVKRRRRRRKMVALPPPHILEGIIPAKPVKSKKTDLLCSYLSPYVEAFLKEQIAKLTK
jgi:hypothetical protein